MHVNYQKFKTLRKKVIYIKRYEAPPCKIFCVIKDNALYSFSLWEEKLKKFNVPLMIYSEDHE